MDIHEAAKRIQPFLEDPAFDFLLTRMREMVTNNEDHYVQDHQMSDEAQLANMRRCAQMRICINQLKDEMRKVVLEAENQEAYIEETADAQAPVDPKE